jgi:hypothetical protein
MLHAGTHDLMGEFGPYLRRVQGGYAHYCPACRQLHALAVERAQPNGARWVFDGNVMAPTFAPSVIVQAVDEEDGTVDRCHYSLTRGNIVYHADSTHALAGREIALPELPPEYRDRPTGRVAPS